MKRTLLVVGIASAILIGAASTAHPHPLGNFTVNRSSELRVRDGQLTVRYAVDVAEVPTFQELAKIDTNGDGKPGAEELSSYARAKASFIAENIVLNADGAPLRLTVGEHDASLQRGDGGLRTLRLDVGFAAALPATTSLLAFEDRNFPSLPGWKEVVASGDIASSDVPRASTSDRLREYPEAAMRRPPNVTSARLHLGESSSAAFPPPQTVDRTSRPSSQLFGERFAGLIERDLSPVSLIVALMLAVAFGAIHALGPGHGKTVTAGYLVGAGTRPRHAVMIASAVAGMHTASVIVLGLATLWLSTVFSPAVVYPWLTLTSGILIIGVGTWLLTVRLRARRHSLHHDHAEPSVSPLSRRGLATIAVSGGLVPSPTAVVVLLGAVALHRIAFGLVLVVAFSIGLAAALSAIGIMTLRARSFAERRWGFASHPLVPSLSSAGIVAMGCFLSARAMFVLAT